MGNYNVNVEQPQIEQANRPQGGSGRPSDFRYATVFSGIEAPSVAWSDFGWRSVFFSEIEPFACALLQQHYPSVPNLGDINQITNKKEFKENVGKIDLLIGGSPCQSFSVAGSRNGLGDERGQLSLQFVNIVQQCQPRWFIWENVPGAISSAGGLDFDQILTEMAKCGYGLAYRILDARFFGVAQRRRRVFVIGYRGDWRPACDVLFEPESGERDSATICESWKNSARTTARGSRSSVPSVTAYGGGNTGGSIAVATCLTHHGVRLDFDSETFILDARGLRRLTPLECERLQGLPDHYTKVLYRNRPASDGSRYKAIGNSMAVPVIRWLGHRIGLYERGLIRSEAV